MRLKSSVTRNQISQVGPEGRRHLFVAGRLAGWAVARELRVDATRLTVAQADAIADAVLAAGLDRLAFWESHKEKPRRWNWRKWPWTRSS